MNLKYQKEIKLPQRIKSKVKKVKHRKEGKVSKEIKVPQRKKSKWKNLKYQKEGKVSEII